MNYEQHKGKEVAEQMKYEIEYEEEVKNFNLMEYLYDIKYNK